MGDITKNDKGKISVPFSPNVSNPVYRSSEPIVHRLDPKRRLGQTETLLTVMWYGNVAPEVGVKVPNLTLPKLTYRYVFPRASRRQCNYFVGRNDSRCESQLYWYKSFTWDHFVVSHRPRVSLFKGDRTSNHKYSSWTRLEFRNKTRRVKPTRKTHWTIGSDSTKDRVPKRRVVEGETLYDSKVSRPRCLDMED